MPKIPKPRGGSSGFGGGSHSESKFKSVRRGGRPSAGRKSSGCALFLIVGLGLTAAIGTGVGHWLAG